MKKNSSANEVICRPTAQNSLQAHASLRRYSAATKYLRPTWRRQLS